MGKPKDDKTGKRYGRLVAEKYIGNGLWECKCDCGNAKIVRSGHLNAGKALSCGCLEYALRSAAGYRHGGIREPLYTVWEGMKQRCTNIKHNSYHNYGGRGIRVCDEWKNDYSAFRKWAISNGYRKGLTLERVNNNDGYSPANCKWITNREQSRNKRSNRAVFLVSESGEIQKNMEQ